MRRAIAVIKFFAVAGFRNGFTRTGVGDSMAQPQCRLQCCGSGDAELALPLGFAGGNGIVS